MLGHDSVGVILLPNHIQVLQKGESKRKRAEGRESKQKRRKCVCVCVCGGGGGDISECE